MSDLHSDCQRRAREETRAVAAGETPEAYWERVRRTMPPYFWNRIAQGRDSLCEWCNKPLPRQDSKA